MLNWKSHGYLFVHEGPPVIASALFGRLVHNDVARFDVSLIEQRVESHSREI